MTIKKYGVEHAPVVADSDDPQGLSRTAQLGLSADDDLAGETEVERAQRAATTPPPPGQA